MRTDTTNDMRALMEENIKLSKSILESTEKTRKHIRRAEIVSFLRLLIIIVPIIIAILYIPPFLKQLSGSFSKLYGGEQFNLLELFKGQGTGGLPLSDIKLLLDKQVK